MANEPIEGSVRDTFRSRVGPVGVWYTAMGGMSAAEERDIAQTIEGQGFGSLWIGETPSNKEAFVHASLLLSSTSRIAVGTGIASIWGRDATAAHNASWAIAEAFPGRFVTGLGVSHRSLTGPRGHTYGSPIQAMTDYLSSMAGSDYEAPQPTSKPPLVLAALRRKMLELSRDATDGAHTYFVTPSHTAKAREILGDASLLIPELAFVLDHDPTTARDAARDHMEWYLKQPNYRNALIEEGFDDDELSHGGSDRLVDSLVAWGGPEQVAARIREHLDLGADHVLLQPLASATPNALTQLHDVARLVADAQRGAIGLGE